MDIYRHEDEDGDWLTITDSGDRDDAALIRAAQGGTEVTRADLPVIVAKLYEACGLPSPVILELPEVGPESVVMARTVRAWLSKAGDGVSIGIDGNSDTLTPDDAERLAAAVTALAARARAGAPDDAEVESLATAIHSATHGAGCGLPPANCNLDAARAALRWMNAKAARS